MSKEVQIQRIHPSLLRCLRRRLRVNGGLSRPLECMVCVTTERRKNHVRRTV